MKWAVQDERETWEMHEIILSEYFKWRAYMEKLVLIRK